jgi:hypothetical protein
MRAYIHAPNPSNAQPAPRTARKRPSEFGIAVIIALAVCSLVRAGDPPADLVKRVAHRESETAEERRQYAYTQSVRIQELDTHGRQQGEYSEVREVIFSPAGDRSERFAGQPVSHLKNLEMTDEDFADIRNIQPFVLTEDKLRIYEVQFKGDELVDGEDCWVLAIRPGQILSGQRLFDGMLWVRKDDFSVIRSEGKAVPEIISLKQENLFPRFVTVRRLVNGFWFPSITSADDTLFFRAGPVREKLLIRYNDYKKFGSDTTITFDK